MFREVQGLSVIGTSIALHKIPVALTLGFLVRKSNMTIKMCSTKVMLGSFILASPVGLIIGIIINEILIDYVLMILQSFAAGTFVYIGVVDLVIKEFHSQKQKMT